MRETKIIVNETEHPIYMFGYIDGDTIMIEMIGKTEREAENILDKGYEITFVNLDGVEAKLPKNNLSGFMEGAEEGNVRVLLK